MKRLVLALCALCTLAFVACHNEEPKDRNTQLEEIRNYESQIQMIRVSTEQADSIVALYNDFVASFPQDSLCPDFLLKAAQVRIAVGQSDSAFAFIDRIIDEYPDFEGMDECYFTRAQAFENTDQYEDAVNAYTYFLENYPNSVNATGLAGYVKQLEKTNHVETIVEDFFNDPKNQNVPIEEI